MKRFGIVLRSRLYSVTSDGQGLIVIWGSSKKVVIITSTYYYNYYLLLEFTNRGSS